MIQPTTLRPPSIIVLGKTTTTPSEADALHTFGWGLAELDQELLTTKSKGVAAAVTAGYVSAGRKPKELAKGALPHQEVVIFTDDALERLLDQRDPNWRDREWLIVTPDLFDTFFSVYLACLAELGTNLIGDHGDGGS